MNDKNKLWREWWAEKFSKNKPVGVYNPLEGHMWEAWNAGWEAAKVCCNHKCNEGRDCPARK
jgi:hypothetical protein